MLTRRRVTPIPGRLAVFTVLLFAAAATAGPARYDQATRSIRLTYTFAEIPSFGMTADQLQSLGRIQKATEDQEAYIRALVQDAGTVIYDATGGRAKIAPFDYVDNIKSADMVISLTTDPERGGWAMMGAIEGRPGQIGLYYKVLQKTPREQSALTVAHELSHYIFALPDEYASAGANGVCPTVNPKGPGCLMDNYFVRLGYYGKFCGDDHNASAPDPRALAHEHKPGDSCQLWVDRFFEKRPPAPASESADPSASQIAAIRPEQPFSGRTRSLIDAATIFARKEIERLGIGRLRVSADPSTSELSRVRRIASKFLDDQMKFLRADLSFVKPTPDQVKTAVGIIAKNAFINPQGAAIEATAYLGKELIERLRVKAREIAASKQLTAPAPRTETLLAGVVDERQKRIQQLQPAINVVKRELISYLRGPGLNYRIGSAPGPDTLGPEEQRIIELIAREAVVGTADASEFGALSEAAKLHIRLSLATAQNLVDVSTFLDIPGSESRLDEFRVARDQLSRFALPGNTFSGFGRRKTLIAAPAPLDPQNDIVRIDAGDGMPYDQIRRLTIAQLTKLIERERIEEVDQMLASPLASANGDDRFRAMNKMVNYLADETRQNRAENIIIISPPGGLPKELSDELEGFRKRIRKNGDVRLDVIEMFSGSLPLRLRDEVHVSGGGVQFVSDIDELGAVAQRLKNDISAGSWVSAPEFGVVNLSTGGGLDKLIPEAAASSANFWTDVRSRFVGSADGRTPGLLRQMVDEIDSELFNRFESITSEHLSRNVLPSDFDKVRAVYTQLHDLKSHIQTINTAVGDLRLGNVAEPTARALADIRVARETIQSMFWPDKSDNFLTRTDDTLDGQLRRTLRERAALLAAWAERLEAGEAKLWREILDANTKFQAAKKKFKDSSLEVDRAERVRLAENLNFLQYNHNVVVRNAMNLRSRAASIYQSTAEYDRSVADLRDELTWRARSSRRRAQELLEIKSSLLDERTQDKDRANLEAQLVAIEVDLARDLREFAEKNERLAEIGERRAADAPAHPDDLIALADNVIAFIHLSVKLNRSEIGSWGANSPPVNPIGSPYTSPKLWNWALQDKSANGLNKDLREGLLRWVFDNTYQRAIALEALEQAANGPIDPIKLSQSIRSLQSLMEDQETTPTAWTRADRAEFTQRMAAVRFKADALRSSSAKPSSPPEPRRRDLELSNPLAMLANSAATDADSTAPAAPEAPAELPRKRTEMAYEDHRLSRILTPLTDPGQGSANKTPAPLTTPAPQTNTGRATEILNLLEIVNAANGSPRRYVSDPDMSKKSVDVKLNLLQSTFRNFLDSRYFTPGAVNLIAKLDAGQNELGQMQRDLVKDWIEQTTLEIYPRTMLAIHERLRDLDARLRLLDQATSAQPGERPVFERIKERRKAAPVDFNPLNDGKHSEVAFGPFQAEEGADYELIIGLSRPLSNFEKLKSNPEEHPQLRLFVEGKLVDRPYLRLEPDLSSDTMLVFRAPKPDLRAGLLGAGLYTPKLLIKHEYMPLVGGDARVSYTFSVGTRRPNVQIIAALRQPQAKDGDVDPAKDPEFAFRGVLAADKLEAIVEAEVFAGAPVLHADVTSTLQRIDRSNLGIETPNYTLKDDGVYPDLLKDDGIYTARITLEPAAKRTAAEYRVMIQARSNDRIKFIPLADPIIHLQDDKVAKEQQEPPPVPPFQRSTSLNFHAAQES